MRKIVLCALFIAVPALTFVKAQNKADPQEAPIQISINPEARVSMALGRLIATSGSLQYGCRFLGEDTEPRFYHFPVGS